MTDAAADAARGVELDVGDVSLWVDAQGSDEGEAVVLVAGADSPGFRWTPAIVDPLVAEGYRVVRFDHRDCGRSTRFGADAAYLLDDLAGDVVGMLDRLDIDVAHEQSLLLDHDVIVFQYPFYWYSTPPILKQWQDLVLEHGWAYGSSGDALEGKSFLSVISAGGGEPAYCSAGYNRFTVRHLLAPLEQTAQLCGMRFLPPFVVFGTHRLAVFLCRRGAHATRRVDRDRAG